MVDTAQVIYEHSVGVTMSFFTSDLNITWTRPGLRIETRPDNVLTVIDPAVYQRIFTCSAILSGANVSTLNGWLIGAITYSGDYPRLTTITLVSGTTLTNIEVAITSCSAQDVGNGQWRVNITFTEKSR